MEFNATFLVSVISFLVFVFIMNKIFYAPLTRIVDERNELLDANYSDAKKFDDDAEGILRDRDNRLADTDAKSRKIISDKIENENVKGKTLTSETSKKSSEEIQKNKEILAKERDLACEDLKSKILGLAETISSKVMGIDVKIDDISQIGGVR